MDWSLIIYLTLKAKNNNIRKTNSEVIQILPTEL